MIINISGTYGSGKSTLVKKVMDSYPSVDQKFVQDRKRPFGYICSIPFGSADLFIPGHYETPCGGCDTLAQFPKMLNFIYALIESHAKDGRHVLYEGSLIESDVRRAKELSERHPFKLVTLDLPLDECLASVKARREARGNFKPLKPKNTIDRHRLVHRRNERLTLAGVTTMKKNREEALQVCLEEFGLAKKGERDESP